MRIHFNGEVILIPFKKSRTFPKCNPCKTLVYSLQVLKLVAVTFTRFCLLKGDDTKKKTRKYFNSDTLRAFKVTGLFECRNVKYLWLFFQV